MDILLSIVAMAVVLGITLYHRMSLVKSVSLLTAAMLVLTITGSVGVIGWTLYVLAIAVFAVSGIRQSLISRKALALFKTVLPAMSQTEKKLSMLVQYGGKLSYSKVNLNGKNYTQFKRQNLALKSKRS